MLMACSGCLVRKASCTARSEQQRQGRLGATIAGASTSDAGGALSVSSPKTGRSAGGGCRDKVA